MIYNISIAFGTVIEDAIGGSVDDTITTNTANNTINGGGGTDTVVFSGARSAYTLTDLGSGSVRVDGPGGERDTLSIVERLQFSDQTVTWPPAAIAGSVSINDVSITEGNAGNTLLTFTVTRTGGTAAFDVNFGTANGTATATDYGTNGGTLSFGTGVNSRTIQNTIFGDTLVEPDETFFVNLSGATNGATISDSQGQGTIINDDTTTIVSPDDFNGDGRSDIPLRSGQQLAEWLMQGTALLAGSGNVSSQLGAG